MGKPFRRHDWNRVRLRCERLEDRNAPSDTLYALLHNLGVGSFLDPLPSALLAPPPGAFLGG